MKKSKQWRELRWLWGAIVVITFYLCFIGMERTEINEVDVIRVLGIDKKDGEFTISGLYNLNDSKSSDGGGVKVIEGSGQSVYEAFEHMKEKNRKNITIAHATYYLIGNGAAKDGLEGCLDFIVRDQTVKMNASIFILLSDSVGEFLDKSVENDMFIHEDLGAISEKQLSSLVKVDNTIVHTLNQSYSKEGYMLIPYLITNNQSIYYNGYAIIKNNRLVTYLDLQTSLTIDLLRGRIRSYPLYIKGVAGTEITKYKWSKKITNKDNKIRANIKLTFDSEIREEIEDKNRQNVNALNRIQTLQEKELSKKIESIIYLSKSFGVDLLGVAPLIQTYQNNRGEGGKIKFSDYAKNVEYYIDLHSNIAQNYVLDK